MKKIVIDMLGGDNGIAATKNAVKEYVSKHDDVLFYCVGNEDEMPDLKEVKNVNVIDAKGIVPMNAGALEVLRMKDTSMFKACETFLNEHCDGIVSCGSTGAFLSLTTIKLKKIDGISRPALISPFPTKIKGKKVVILDIGASTENNPDELVQFALMGKCYSSSVLGVSKPKVFLLANGTEEGKGSISGKEAYKLLKDKEYFYGNIEAREALEGEADVIVCDGYSGNVLLKSIEGTAKMMSGFIKKAFKKNIFSKIGYLFAKKGFDEMTETMDYKSTGGAMLMGVNGVVVKAHGNSDEHSFKCAIDVAYKLIDGKVVENIRSGLSSNE